MHLHRTIVVPVYLCEAVQLELTVIYKTASNYDVDTIAMVEGRERYHIPKAAYDLMIIGSVVDIEEAIQEAIENRLMSIAA